MDLKPQSGTLKSRDEIERGKYIRTEDREGPRKAAGTYIRKRSDGWVSPEFKSLCDRLWASVTKGRTFVKDVYPHRDKQATRLIAWAREQPGVVVGIGYRGTQTFGRPSVYVELAADRMSTN